MPLSLVAKEYYFYKNFRLKVHYQIENFTAKNIVLTMGMFDGVHLGHRTILKRLKQIALEKNSESLVLTFWPHPRLIIDPFIPHFYYLNTLNEKLELFQKTGIDHIVVLPFTKELSKLKANEFIEQVLIGKLNMSYLVAGFNHHFGNDRKGSIEDLKKCSKTYGFGVEKLDAFEIKGIDISSTKIRDLIKDGRVKMASQLLDYSYFILGNVIKGNRIGRTIGFPTANIQVRDKHKLIPGSGVYAVKIRMDENEYKGMLNIGIRPTIDEKEKQKSIEVHILDFEQDIYNQEISVQFIQKIRDEQKFESIQALQWQLEKDKKNIISILEKK